MTDQPSDLVFMDTETMGLNPLAPIWEFAAVRRPAGGGQEVALQFFIDHDPEPWLADYQGSFREDYEQRYDQGAALSRGDAADEIMDFMHDRPHVVGAVPNFDTERLDILLALHGYNPPWHYHLIDVENVVVGYLAAQGRLIEPPWSSDGLSAAVGIDPDDYARHTAMGDVRWTQAQWDAVMYDDSPLDEWRIGMRDMLELFPAALRGRWLRDWWRGYEVVR